MLWTLVAIVTDLPNALCRPYREMTQNAFNAFGLNLIIVFSAECNTILETDILE